LVGVAWTPQAIVYLLFALIGGALIQLAMRLLIVSFSFRALSVNAPMSIVDSLFNDFGTYPLSIFNAGLQLLLTFAVPVAFMAYFPATVLFERTAELHVHPLIAYGAPLVGVLWMAAALRVFEREMRNYKSAGH
jgi:ABC-2 type transport system permease protein